MEYENVIMSYQQLGEKSADLFRLLGYPAVGTLARTSLVATIDSPSIL